MTGPVFTFRGEAVAKNFIFNFFLCEPINDAGLVDIVRRHFEFHAVANRKANKTFAHFSRNMREHKVLVCQRDTKHCAGKNRQDCPFHFNSFFQAHILISQAGPRNLSGGRLHDSLPAKIGVRPTVIARRARALFARARFVD